jgi:hypothetical protein
MADKSNVLVGVVQATLGVGSGARVLGYTTDGVTMSVKSETADIKVDEVEGSIIRRLTGQEMSVSLNLAEGDLESLLAAIPGAVLTSPTTITLGSGALQESRLTLVGVDPAGKPRLIILTAVNPVGEVGIPFKKGEVSVIPVTFGALVADTGVFGTVEDATATPPTLTVGASTKSNAGGTVIEAKFSGAMANPASKHGEFWFAEADFATSPRFFSAAALHGGDNTILDLTVSGVAITAGKALRLYYARGSVFSAAGGLLASFANQVVVARP